MNKVTDRERFDADFGVKPSAVEAILDFEDLQYTN